MGFAPIIAVIGMISAFALALGFTYPALSLSMAAQGISETVIGAHGAMAGLGLMVGAPLLPWLTTRINPWYIAAGSFCVTIICLAGFGLTQSLVAWFLLRFLLGVSVTTLFVISETWLNELAPDHLRGRIVAVYTSSLAGFFGVGPLLIPYLGHTGLVPYLTVAGLVTLLALPLAALKHVSQPVEPLPWRSMGRVLIVFPVIFFAVFSFGVMDGTFLPLWGVYAIERGVDEGRAVTLLTVLIIGNVLFQLPIGWLADRVSRRLMMIVCAAAGCIGAVTLPFLDLRSLGIWPFLVVWGSLSFGVYTIAMTIVGQHLRGVRLVAANAAFSILWGAGTLIGSAATGALMDQVGPVGLSVTIGIVFGLLTLAAVAIPIVRQ